MAIFTCNSEYHSSDSFAEDSDSGAARIFETFKLHHQGGVEG